MNRPKPITLTQAPAEPGERDPQPFEVRGPLPGIPEGGNTGDVLSKTGPGDYDTAWVHPDAPPPGSALTWGAFYSTTSQPLSVTNQATSLSAVNAHHTTVKVTRVA